MKDTAKTILLLVGTAAAGVAIGMLMAPYKGVETRRKLIKGGRRFSKGIQQVAGIPMMKYYQWKMEKQYRADLLDGDGNPLGMA